jgi:Ni/Co efflux regulator RcnB
VIPFPAEKRSWGPLIATIDLLFLVVAFFALLLFFVQQQKQNAVAQLEQVQATVSGGGEAPSAPDAAQPASAAATAADSQQLIARLQHLMELQGQETERQRERQAREERRGRRETSKLEYQVLPGGRIGYQGHSYAPADFRRQVVQPLRDAHWVALRAYAPQQTPFGDVVASRRLLLENGGEFDTYWDNVTESEASRRKP